MLAGTYGKAMGTDELQHWVIVAQYQPFHVAQRGCTSSGGQSCQEQRAYAVALPGIVHDQGDLALVGLSVRYVLAKTDHDLVAIMR